MCQKSHWGPVSTIWYCTTHSPECGIYNIVHKTCKKQLFWNYPAGASKPLTLFGPIFEFIQKFAFGNKLLRQTNPIMAYKCKFLYWNINGSHEFDIFFVKLGLAVSIRSTALNILRSDFTLLMLSLKNLI